MKCTDKEQLTCNVEKMGCEGCYYNDEIQVGEYVRMLNGLIAKIVSKDKDEHFILDRYYAGGRHLTEIEVKNDITKHSPNIKDLIEEGDFVNGMCMELFDDEEGTYLGFPIYDDGLMDCIEYVVPLDTMDIKNIVTHEMFESVKYEV